MGTSHSSIPIDPGVRSRLKSKHLTDKEIDILWSRFKRMDKDNDGQLKYQDLENSVSVSERYHPLKERIILAFMNYSRTGMDRGDRKQRATMSFEDWVRELTVYSHGTSEEKLSFVYRVFNDYNETELGRDAVESLIREFHGYIGGNSEKKAKDYIEAAQKRGGKSMTGDSIDLKTFRTACMNPVSGRRLHLENMMYLRLFRPGIKPLMKACVGNRSS